MGAWLLDSYLTLLSVLGNNIERTLGRLSADLGRFVFSRRIGCSAGGSFSSLLYLYPLR